MAKTILYISSNDGTDMRIVKEVRSLSHKYTIVFVGVQGPGECYVRDYCSEIFFTRGARRNPLTVLKQFFLVLQLLLTRKINSIHVINEQLMLFFYPLLFFKPTVLDLFDSIFLKKNLPGNKAKILKKIVYAPINKIIVTDNNRLDLMPDFVRAKCLVLPNYPNKIENVPNKKRGNLTIMFNGWMGCGRGTEIIEGLLNTNRPIKIIMAGWFSDEHTKKLVTRFPDKIDYRGVLPQREALLLTAEKADYILCTYAPTNQNNINASPNKIYDAIQLVTPVIINQEVKVSKWLKEENLGYIMESYNAENYIELYDDLVEQKDQFKWSNALKEKYTWENVENVLISSHSYNG